jgi:hypothetical protein
MTKQEQINCINKIFPNQINLKINKRLKNEKDKEMMMNLKNDLLNSEMPIADIITKYKFKTINSMSSLKTKKNVCYFNESRAQIVNNYVHSHIVETPKDAVEYNGVKLWKGLDLVCKNKAVKAIKVHDMPKSTKFTFFKNYHYTIKNIDGNIVTLYESSEDISIDVNIKSCVSYFSLPYADTVHSIQGTTIDDHITIFDANTRFANRCWVWTALTRTTDFNNVTFFIHDEKELRMRALQKVNIYLKNKCDGYVYQDKKANRTIDPKIPFVSCDWIQENFCEVCPDCKIPLELYFNHNNDINSNISVDRINNSLPHYESNCRVCCVSCDKLKK